jgi:ribosomal protein S18 acetylase RimI-like enzyme
VTTPPPALRIREATASDYEGLCALFEEVDTQHREHLPQLFRTPQGPPREREVILRLITNTDSGLFVAEVGDELVGLVCVLIRETPSTPILVPQRIAIVDDLVVCSHHRRCGIGRALLQQAHEWASAHGAARIQLTVYEFNRAALAFYRSMGYRTLRRGLDASL